MPTSDAEYHRLRETQERARAARATHPDIRRIHLELARHYAARLREDARRGG